MKTHPYLFAMLAFLAMFAGAELQAQPSEFQQFVANTLLERNVAGVSAVRIENGQIAEQFALTHPDLADQPITAQSVFQVGSISKPVAAWTVMTLVRDGKIDLDAPISHYVTRWQLPDSEFDHDQITVRRLLSHSAGLSLHGYPGFPEGETRPTVEASLSGHTGGAGDVFVALKPGEKFMYSGGGYTLVQLMVEEVTGMAFSDYAQQQVLAPLGMTSTSYAPDESLKSQRATPYSRLEPVAYFQFTAEAAASLHSTSADLARFALANMYPNPVLDKALIDEMHAGEIDVDANKVGMGFFIEPEAGLVGHNGANQGWRAVMVFAPETGSGLIVLTNGNKADLFNYQVRCYWEARFSKGALTQRCNARISNIQRRTTLLYLGAWLLTFASLGLILWRFVSLRRGKIQLGLPATKLRWSFVVLLLAGLIVGKVLLDTAYGVYLIAGFTTALTAMDYVPQGFEELWSGGQNLLLCLIGFLFARRVQTA